MTSPQVETLRTRAFFNVDHSSKNETLENEKETKAAEDFEALYFSHVIKTVFAESEGNLFGEGHAGELLKSIWVNTIAQASHSSLGISKKIKETLSRKPEYNLQNNQGGFYNLSV
jgi:hypothetical protein